MFAPNNECLQGMINSISNWFNRIVVLTVRLRVERGEQVILATPRPKRRHVCHSTPDQRAPHTDTTPTHCMRVLLYTPGAWFTCWHRESGAVELGSVMGQRRAVRRSDVTLSISMCPYNRRRQCESGQNAYTLVLHKFRDSGVPREGYGRIGMLSSGDTSATHRTKSGVGSWNYETLISLIAVCFSRLEGEQELERVGKE
ncbi:hypothetical protein CBL_03126 [Carabus blaptoides fortunei]